MNLYPTMLPGGISTTTSVELGSLGCCVSTRSLTVGAAGTGLALATCAAGSETAEGIEPKPSIRTVNLPYLANFQRGFLRPARVSARVIATASEPLAASGSIA